ncbi:MAG: SAM-dependent chlorinase/fluorinase [Planctomycetota bacterium]|nr:SAM-dependent chlorinase/fluorinase [Planctomycetota bacterium]
MARPPILTLTTDFGARGPYVAAIKGVVLGLVPQAHIVDVTHAVTPQDILEGSFVLAGVLETFPTGTVHMAVIDPGVGTDRSIIAVSLCDHWFVVPDNGLITCVARGRTPRVVHEISNPVLRRNTVSATFHGRDIMAPAAAHLLCGNDPGVLGPARSKFIVLKNFEPSVDSRGFLAEVIFRDSFGNLITNIEGSRLEAEPGANWVIEVAGARIEGLCRTYADRPSGTLVALVGSSGWVEVAVVNGDASRALNAGPGSTVWMRKDLIY